MKKYSISYGYSEEPTQGWTLAEFDTKEEARKAWESLDPYKTANCGWRDDYAIIDYDLSAYDDETGEFDYEEDESKTLAWFNEKEFGIDERDICFDYGLDESDKETLESIIEERKEKVENLRKRYRITKDNLDY